MIKQAVKKILHASIFLTVILFSCDSGGGGPKPEITVFALQGGVAEVSNAMVAITFEAVGNKEITGWCINETGNQPEKKDVAWLPLKPEEYTMENTLGTHTLYAWVKDAGNNISEKAELIVIYAYSDPYVKKVEAVTEDGIYGRGNEILIKVVFSEEVVVTSGTPVILLANTAMAYYISGSGTSSLIFTYTVSDSAEENCSDLNYAGQIDKLQGNIIALDDGTSAYLKLPDLDSLESLAGGSEIIIDAESPYLIDVTSSAADGGYIDSDIIPIQLVYNESVYVSGIPSIILETGTNDAEVFYSSGSGTNILTFNYTVSGLDMHTTIDTGTLDVFGFSDLNYRDQNSFSLNGGSIVDAAGNSLESIQLFYGRPVYSLGGNKSIVVDSFIPDPLPVGLGPHIYQFKLSYNSSNIYYPNVKFSLLGSDDAELWMITETAVEPDLTDPAWSEEKPSEYAIDDVFGDYTLYAWAMDAEGNISDSSQITFEYSFTVPMVLNVETDFSNGSYNDGDVIPIKVVFSEPVDVTSTPQLTLETGTNDAVVDYSSGTGTDTLIFNYTVSSAQGHRSTDLNYQSRNALALNSGTITSAAAPYSAYLYLPDLDWSGSLGSSSDIVIDTSRPVLVDVTSSAPDGNYGDGDVIPVQLVFNESVYVSGSPYVLLETGILDSKAFYVSGSGTSTLTFNYTVSGTDVHSSLDTSLSAVHGSNDLSYIDENSFKLNGAVIADEAGNQLENCTLFETDSAHSLRANKTLVIDTRDYVHPDHTKQPAVVKITSPVEDGYYLDADQVPIYVLFSEPVFITGAPQILLETGANDTLVNYVSGSGSRCLVFNYVPNFMLDHETDDLDVANTQIVLNAGDRIIDSNGENVQPGLPEPGAAGSLSANKEIIIDSTAPVFINMISSSLSGVYGDGDTIVLHIIFSEPVLVTGTPQLTLETGVNDAVADYIGGSGSTELKFEYVISGLNNHNTIDLDYVDEHSLALNGGSINDVAGCGAFLTLPAPGTVGSLGYNYDIVIDTN